MPGRIRRLLPMLSVMLLGMLSSGAGAQEAKPNEWPPIDVWGVGEHSIGTIRIAQPTVKGVLRYSLVAAFTPADGKTLAELAAALWPGVDAKCLHFNWIQVTLRSGNLPLPVSAAGLPLNSPFLDPPAGGYQGDPKPADTLPWFLDETPYVRNKTADMNIHNPDITQAKSLSWYVKPYSAATPDSMRYDTVLVLINDCTFQYEPLGGFHWQANFPQNDNPYFEIKPFLATEPFPYGDLVTDFDRSSRLKKKVPLWSIRPRLKP